MRVQPGSRIGPYEITARLGEGGMGEVWRATDTKLRRDVAVKVLPAAFTADPERLARFEREAQLLAQLQHPNIASIYGLEEAEGTRALVLELVEGPTLAERLGQGALPLREALSIARQIAEALEEAHEKGIVHRDLKPQNVKASTEGKTKVLDFGLAKAMDPTLADASAADPSRSPALMNSPTLTAAGTQLGTILGTAAYMAPEQARGAAVDKRADIWAFGVVLHEMLSGRTVFLADTVPDTLAAVLTREIEWSDLPESTPPALRRLLRRCLERSTRSRLHDIADARIVIEELLAGGGDEADSIASNAAPRASRISGWPARLAWAAAGLAAGALVMAGPGRGLLESSPPTPPIVRSLTYSGTSFAPSVSADGRYVAFTSNRDGSPRIWLKQMASGEEVALTEGPDFNAQISPDSSTVLFTRSSPDQRTDLYRVPQVGGEPRRLARSVDFARWSPDGREIAFSRNVEQRARVVIIPAEGGEERLLVERADQIVGLDWSPDGSRLVVRGSARVNTLANQFLATIEVASGEFREIYRIPVGGPTSPPIWDGNRALLFTRSPTQAGRGAVLLQRLELGAASPQPIFSLTSPPFRIELAGPGSIVFDGGGARQSLIEVGIGTALGRTLTGGPTVDRQPAFSPDGRRVVFTSDRSGSLDLWSLELESGAVRRLTFDDADDWDPHWSADGEHLLWSSNRGGNFEIWIAEPDGSGSRQLTADGVDAENPTMSADGAWVVYSSGNPAASGLWKIRPDGSDATHLLPGNYLLPELAPGTGWIAAVENDGLADGSSPIRVVRLEDGATVAELRVPGEMSNNGRSRWMPDGRTLVSWGRDDLGRTVLFRQPIVPGRNTDAQRELLVASEEQRSIESFGVSPVDGRVVVSAGWGESDLLVAEGIPGIGESLRDRRP